MRRRDFIFGLLGAAPVLSDIACVRAAGRVWRVGQVGPGSGDDPQFLLRAFSEKLAEFGYQQGRNLNLTRTYLKIAVQSRSAIRVE